jgi:hypothetical protein
VPHDSARESHTWAPWQPPTPMHSRVSPGTHTCGPQPQARSNATPTAVSRSIGEVPHHVTRTGVPYNRCAAPVNARGNFASGVNLTRP